MGNQTSVLNLYAGIGGNRKRWENVDVTAVEWDEDKAEVYRDHFPDDTVVVDDAHEYLRTNHERFDFIWASPPCPTHSKMRRTNKDIESKYPDMRLYQEVLLLKHDFDGDYVVENVNPYYDPLIEPQIRGRHAFWSNFHIPPAPPKESDNIVTDGNSDGENSQGRKACLELADRYGFDLREYDFSMDFLRKIVNNCVRPELGEHILNAAVGERQATVADF